MADGTLTIVTGASSNHYRCLRNLLFSLDLHETAPIVVYDLGLTPEEADALRAEGRQVVRFPFERCPAFFGTSARMRAPCAWKPVLIREVMERTEGPVLWLDAGDLVHEKLDKIRAVLSTTGFYSPTSSDTIALYTHPRVVMLLDAQPEILNDPNRNGAVVGFGRNEIALDLSRIWRDCALREEIMLPPGWTMDLYRSDQAILSVLVAQFRRRYQFAQVDERLGVSIHNDYLTLAQASLYMREPASSPPPPRIPKQKRARAVAVRPKRHRRKPPLRRLWRKLKRMLRGPKAGARSSEQS